MTDRRGDAAYRRLLWLFPGPFREDHADEMRKLFAEMRAEWEEERGGAGFRFWLGVVWDTAREAGAEWLNLIGETTRSVGTKNVGEHMSALFGDVRFAVRQIVRQPLYSSMVVVLMALGIAGNAAVFRVFNGLFLKPLPFDEPGQLVDVNETAPSWNLEFLQVAYRDFVEWKENNSSFESLSAYDFGGGNLVTDDGAIRVSYLSATHDIDDVLRLTPALGRFFGPDEDRPDGPRGGLLSQAFWEQQFGRDPEVLGRTVSINGFPIEIIGVLPPEARAFSDSDMWLPLRADPDQFQGWGLLAIGRLNPDVSVDQALADLTAIHKGLIDRWEVNEISSPVIHTLRERYLGDYELGAGVLLGAVFIVLLIACANIAGLMTARSVTRAPELGVRRALGAPRGRIVRQLLTESLVLAVFGAALGTALGVWGSEMLVGPLAEQFPNWVSFDLDRRFLGFTVAATTVAAILFGLAPAMRASVGSAAAHTNRTTSSASSRRAMTMLVSGEVALALTLLIVSGLSVLDVRELGRVDPGFDAEGLVSYQVALPTHRYADGPARLSFTERYLERLGAVPGIESAAVTSALPLGGHWGQFFVVEGAPPRAQDEANPVVLHRAVSADYFETLGIELAAGRVFEGYDGREGESPVIIVNETFVRTHLSHLDNPIGARITSGTEQPGPDAEDVQWLTVIGVTRDVLHYGVDTEMRPGVYQPLPQNPLRGFQVALATRGDTGPIMSEVRGITAELDVELPVYRVQLMTEELNESLYTRRALVWLTAVFSGVALLMSIAGIYGIISYSVGQRSQEISIRMAMGAQAGTVLQQIVMQGMRLVVLGAAVGLVVSLASAQVVSGILVGVSPTNPVVYVSVTLLVIAVAAAANYLPARRAARLDPMNALRRE